MPTALLFVPCKTYHVDTATNQHSVGKILQDVELTETNISGAHRPPVGKWHAVALLHNFHEDHGKDFAVELDLKFPDGSIVDLPSQVFKAHKSVHWYNSTHSDDPNTLLFNRFAAGDYDLRMWVHDDTKPRHEKPTASFPFTIRITHLVVHE